MDSLRDPATGRLLASIRAAGAVALATGAGSVWAVSRELGMRVNVEGTRHVLEFLASCASFRRLHYVSTAYVSGDATGVFRETDLEVGQGFKNYYEETKYLAEVLAVKSGLSVTTYRPAIVMGDSRTCDGIFGAVCLDRAIDAQIFSSNLSTGSHATATVTVRQLQGSVFGEIDSLPLLRAQ